VFDGWTDAGDVAPDDLIRDKDLRPLTVLAVEVDDTPTRVHNLEIADAHTYFAGELEAWGHNAKNGFGAYIIKLRDGSYYSGKGPRSRRRESIIERMAAAGSALAWYLYFPAPN